MGDYSPMHTNPSRPTRAGARLRTVSAVAVAFGLILGVSACSSEEEPDICSLSSELSNNADAPNAVVADARRTATKIKSITPPDEIKAEWAVLADYFVKIADKLNGAADDDKDAFTAASIEVGDSVDPEAMGKASKKVTEYVDANCEG